MASSLDPYLEVAIVIELPAALGGGHPIDLESSLGTATGRLTANLDPALVAPLAAWFDHGGGAESPMALARSVGERLYEAVFGGDNRALGERLLSTWRAAEANPAVRMRLRLRIADPALACLPWELMYCQRADRPVDGFLAESMETIVVRAPPNSLPACGLDVTLPLQALLVLPATPGLNLAEEQSRLEEIFQHCRDIVRPTFLSDTVTFESVSRALADPYHVLHFAGHGRFTENGAALRLTNADGDEDWIHEDRLAALFARQPALRLVVLNACETARVSSTQAFVGLAPSLVDAGVAAVVAMQFSVGDDLALAFSRSFFQSLFRGVARGDLEMAVIAARRSVRVTIRDRPGFGAPVLYLRSRAGILFDLPRGGIQDYVPMSLSELLFTARKAEVQAESVRALEAAPPADEAATLRRGREVARLRSLRQRLLLGLSVLGIALGTTVTAMLMTLLGLLDFAHMDHWTEDLELRIGNVLRSDPIDERVAIVERVGKPVSTDEERNTSRLRSARVLDRLSAAGARVVALAYDLTCPSAEDAVLADAIRRARDRGTAVVLSDDAAPPLLPDPLKAALAESRAAPGVSAISCTGRIEGRDVTEVVAILPLDDAVPRAGLALQIHAAYAGAVIGGLDPVERSIAMSAPDGRALPDLLFTRAVRVEPGDAPGCPAVNLRGTLAEVYLDTGALQDLRRDAHRFAEDDILSGARTDTMKDRIVLVGLKQADDSTHASPLEQHALALSTLLGSHCVRIASAGLQAAFYLVLAISVVVARLGSRSRRQFLVAVAVLAVLDLVAVLGFAAVNVTIHFSYHIAAAALAWWLTANLERRWLSWKRPI